ncbi:MAG: hypothetical protein NTV30_05830, partial [Chloroflexi bacterium]|nr:hypothetical protein [Chloroflexota bacterium]
MITPVQQKIHDKTIKASEWEAMVKSGDWLCFGGAGSDAMACPDVLADRVGEGLGMVKNIELWTYGHFNPMRLHEIDQQEEFHCHHEGFFFPWARKHHDKTLCIDYIPWGWSLGLWNAYYRFFHKEKNKRRL